MNEDVHLDDHHIYLRKTKNGTERIIPICESLSFVLKEYIANRNRLPIPYIDSSKQSLFIKADGTIIRSNAVYQHFRKLLVACGIPYIGSHHGPRVHDLRHTFAVHSLIQMDRNGMDLYTGLPLLSTILGHHSLKATEQYVRLTFAMYPELEHKSSVINAFVYPKVCMAYDNDDRLC